MLPATQQRLEHCTPMASTTLASSSVIMHPTAATAAVTSLTSSTIAPKHELRYLPIATMPTKHSCGSSSTLINNGKVVQPMPNGTIQPTVAFTTTNTANGNAGVIQLVPASTSGVVTNSKSLLPALAIIAPTTTMLPITSHVINSGQHQNNTTQTAAPVLIRTVSAPTAMVNNKTNPSAFTSIPTTIGCVQHSVGTVANLNTVTTVPAVLSNGQTAMGISNGLKPYSCMTTSSLVGKDAIEQLVKYGQVNAKPVITTSVRSAPPPDRISKNVIAQQQGQQNVQQQQKRKQSQTKTNTSLLQKQKKQESKTQQLLTTLQQEKELAKSKQTQTLVVRQPPIKNTMIPSGAPLPEEIMDRENDLTYIVIEKLLKKSVAQQNSELQAKPVALNKSILLAAINAPKTQSQLQEAEPMANVPMESKEDNVETEGAQRIQQRSKSLNNDCIQSDTMERRHSVAVMAKDNNRKGKTQTVIETITINDDEDEDGPIVSRSASASDADDEADAESNSCINLIEEDIAKEQETTKCISRSFEQMEIDQRSDTVPTKNSASEESKQKQQKTVKDIENNNFNIVKAESLQLSKEDFEKSLLCDEKIRNSPSSSNGISPNSSGGPLNRITLAPFARIGNDLTISRVRNSATTKAAAVTNSRSLLAPIQTKSAVNEVVDTDVEHNSNTQTGSNSRTYSEMFNMLSAFNMLSWRERVGFASDSNLRFELNEFNLLQLRERCDKRQGSANYFERSLFERPTRRTDSSVDPLLYLCKRCNCHGPASEFLAPKFCSMSCLRRNSIKRKSSGNSHFERNDRKYRRLMNNSESLVKKPFRWSEYLSNKSNGCAAPIHLFFNPFPIGPNCFERGMKLEAIDPENCSLFCVCTIVDVRGYRLKLSFDGYPSMYDFWINADSMDIFPPGWCAKTQRILQPPKGYDSNRFDWDRYLIKMKARAAPWHLFTHLNSMAMPITNPFKVGMHIEAEDLNDTGKICVATVADILDERVRVHFDGWDDCYDFWVHISSPYIHPCGWHEGRQQLIVPPNYKHAVFKWPKYIKEVGGDVANPEFFAPRDPMDFKAEMKLEVVDQRNPCLIRPATVVTRKGYRIQLHLDCWPSEYFFWLEDDSPDLHPIGWCEATAHELEAPPGYKSRPAQMPCDVTGCRGYGNARRFHLNVHALRDCCPYAPENWSTKVVKPTRITTNDIITELRKTSQTIQQEELVKVKQLPVANQQSLTPPLDENVKLATSHFSKEESPTQQEASAVAVETMQTDVKPFEHVSVTLSPPLVEINERCCDIAKPFVVDYGPRFARNYKLWQENSDFDLENLTSNPLYWTRWDVFEFVERTLNSEEVAKIIFEEDIDGRAFLMMNQDDLTEHLDIKLGPAIKLFSTIIHLRMAVVCKFNTIKSGLNIFESVNDSITDDEHTQSSNDSRPRRRK